MLARSVLFRRAAPALAARRTFASTAFLRSSEHKEVAKEFTVSKNLEEATSPETLFGPGTTEKGKQPSSFEIATGLERLEVLGKLEGIDIFDMKPLVQDRKGTPDDPIVIDSFDRFRYVGCTGFPAGSSEISWLRVEEGKIARDWDSGCCYTLNYLGPEEDLHHH